MGKIRLFFYSLKGSFTSRAYYAEVLGARFSFSLKFFLFYFLLYALVATPIITVRYILPLQRLLSVLPAAVVDIYPQELVVTVKDGQVSTNVEEPYYIPVERFEEIFENLEGRVLGEEAGKIKYLVVIDTDGRVADFYDYQTTALVTRNMITVLDDDGGMRTIPLKDMSDMVISRQLIDDFVGKLVPYLKLVLPLMVVATFFFLLIFLPLSKLFYLIFFGLIVWLVARVMKVGLGYTKSYQMGLHLVVIATTVFSLINLVGSLVDFRLALPFLQTIFLTVLAVWILKKVKEIQRRAEAGEGR